MIIIADSNIFMSALVNPTGRTASILAERKKIQYIVPDYLIVEVTEHIPDLVKRFKNQKTKKERGKTYLCGPASWPAQLAADPAQHCSSPSSSSPRPEAAACSRARGRAATSCLPTPSWPRGRRRSPSRFPPALAHSPPFLPRSLSLSAEHHRRRRSP